jgi:hypothetical protein
VPLCHRQYSSVNRDAVMRSPSGKMTKPAMDRVACAGLHPHVEHAQTIEEKIKF